MAAKKARTGQRSPRPVGTRKQSCGRFLIVTDAETTEKNYFEGLRDDLHARGQSAVSIRVIPKVPAKKLIEKCSELKQKEPNWPEVWIVFDRDRVPDFDKIVAAAHERDVKVGWSNPCIESWFEAHFRSMRDYGGSSKKCCSSFGALLQQKAKREYKKNDPDIYRVLKDYGDETAACDRAAKRMKTHRDAGHLVPSKMVPGTTVHELVRAIRDGNT